MLSLTNYTNDGRANGKFLKVLSTTGHSHMDSVVINNAANSFSRTDAASDQTGKAGPSKFDKVREATMSQEQSEASGTAEASRTSSIDQSSSVHHAQSRDTVGAVHPASAFADDLKTARGSLDQLNKRVSALPNHESLQPLRKQLVDLETQFAKAGQAVNGMTGTSTPQQLLKLQSDMFQLNEHLSIMSKMVDQMTSGVKSILQTQI
jgi:hypothetical protein